MSFFLLIVSILFEVAGTTSLKLSQGFSKPVPAILMGVFYIISFSVFSLALKKLDVSMAYAVWAGMGTALIATIGMLWFKEPFTLLKLGSIALIIFGVIGLNLSGAH